MIRSEQLELHDHARRLRFKIWRQEPYAPWCQLQDPGGPCKYRASVYEHTCLDARNEPVDCEVMFLCEYCACDSQRCFAVVDPTNDGSLPEYARFDLMLDGDHAQGTAYNLEPQTGELRLFATE